MKCVDKLLYTFACVHKSEIIQIFVPTLYAFLYFVFNLFGYKKNTSMVRNRDFLNNLRIHYRCGGRFCKYFRGKQHPNLWVLPSVV